MKKKLLGDTLNDIKTEKKQKKAMQQYSEILEWLYTNDGAFETKTDWRESFNQLLREIILEEEYECDDCCTCN